MRRWRMWYHYKNYFPIKLVKTCELDPKRNYLLCSHPHGILSSGAFVSFFTEGNDVSNVFSGLTIHGITLWVNFMIPLFREWCLALGKTCMHILLQYLSRQMLFKTVWLAFSSFTALKTFEIHISPTGLCSARKESMSYLLSHPEGGKTNKINWIFYGFCINSNNQTYFPGKCVVLVPGGAPEALDSHPGSTIIQLKKRKGFIKLALQNGYILLHFLLIYSTSACQDHEPIKQTSTKQNLNN